MGNNKPLYFFKKIILGYLECFIKEYNGVINFDNEDIEPIHRMRVATRRLRVAFRILKPLLPYKKYNLWKKEIRKMGGVLGFARQLDVQIKFLENTKKTLPENLQSVYIEKIIDDLKKKRNKEQKNIYFILENFARKNKLEEIEAGLKKLISLRGISETLFTIQAKIVILKYLHKFLSFSHYVYKPQNIKKLHRMRIATKKLRYALEILQPWYEKKTVKYINTFHKIQDLLGEIHDYDVLTVTLNRFLNLNKKDKEFYKTSNYVLKKIFLLRRQKYNQFVRYWKDLEYNNFWVKLRQVV